MQGRKEECFSYVVPVKQQHGGGMAGVRQRLRDGCELGCWLSGVVVVVVVVSLWLVLAVSGRQVMGVACAQGPSAYKDHCKAQDHQTAVAMCCEQAALLRDAIRTHEAAQGLQRCSLLMLSESS